MTFAFKLHVAVWLSAFATLFLACLFPVWLERTLGISPVGAGLIVAVFMMVYVVAVTILQIIADDREFEREEQELGLEDPFARRPPQRRPVDDVGRGSL